MLRPNLSELTAFATIAEHGGFRAAAKILGVSPSALSHAIQGLESRIGTLLFHRTTRSLALTEAGEQLLQRVVPALESLNGALNEVASINDKPSGLIKINAAEASIRILIRHVLPSFLEKYPDIQVEFIEDSRYVDIVANGFDAGIRLIDEVPQNMIAIRLRPDWQMIAVASPDYIEKHGVPKIPKDLLKHQCIRIRFASGAIYHWHLERNGESFEIDVPGVLTLGNANLMIDAALEGVGIAWVPDVLVFDYLAKKQLIQLLPDWSPYLSGPALYYPPNRYLSIPFRLFTQAVREWAQTSSSISLILEKQK